MNTPNLASNVLPYRQPVSSRTTPKQKQVRLNPNLGPDFHDLLASVWENSTDAMRVTDSDGVIVAVNNAYCRFVSMERGELVGKLFTIVYDQTTDPSHLIEKYRSRFSEKSVEPPMMRQIRLTHGKVAHVETSNSFIDGNDGETYILTIVHDITEHKQLEEALERERGLLRTVIDNLPDRIFAKDTQSRFIINNDAHIQALGTGSQSEVIGKTDFDFRPRELAQGMFIDDQEVIHSGKRILENEEQSVDPSGKSVCRSVTKVPMRDKQGTVVGLVGISRDITERKQAEAALAWEQYLLNALLQNIPDHIYFKDTQSRFLRISKAQAEMFGLSDPAQAVGKSDFDFFTDQHARPAFEDEQEIMRTGQPLSKEERETWHDRSDTWVLTTKMPFRDKAGKIIGTFGVSRDITEQKAFENREREHVAALKSSQESLAGLNAQKDRLFSILSHDLRSPFTSILGFCGILLNEAEVLSDADRKEFLGHIENSAKKQLELLNKLLDWSRLETNRIKFDITDVDLSAVARTSVSSHLGIAKQKEITLRSTLPQEMKTRGDATMIMQVFNNLISNALKFTPAHGEISIDLFDSKEDHWVMAIKDSGTGIPKDDFRKLFKIEEKYTRKGLSGEEGTGLGLSVVYEIIKKHSGSITIESEVGKGTTFFVRFPKLLDSTEHCVLIVDDDEGVRVLHSRYLKRMFAESRIIQAADGKEALELAKRYRPQIIVTDYSMPEMNGFEFLNFLRQEETTKDIPVFVITGKDSTASMEAMRLSGAVAVLTKPVSATQLQEAIEKVMADRV